MIGTMNSELQKQYENMDVLDMTKHLKMLYQGSARHKRFKVSNAFFQTKLSMGSHVVPHVVKMIGYVENLERFGFALERELAIDLIMKSLAEIFK